MQRGPDSGGAAMRPVVILGSGLAGYSVAREFRKRDKSQPLVLITAEQGDFYSKPALSEAFGSGIALDRLVSRPAAAMAGQVKGEVLAGTRVLTIDAAAREVATTGGTLAYDKLVLALGAEPVRLDLDRDARDRIFAVNDLADYRRFRGALDRRKTVIILGAGLIGCEFAHDLRLAGHQVKVIDLAPWPLNRLLPAENGRFLQDALEQLGVEWHLGAGIAAVERTGAGVRVGCADGRWLEGDLVLSAIGLRPRTALAREAGLEVGRGIAVDRSLRTSDANIFALGDCAELQGHWLPYIAPIPPAARAIAAQLAGGHAEISYPPMPVIVKTPCCPTVACPPPAGVEGAWTVEADGEGMRSLWHDRQGRLRGFALQGARAAHAERLVPDMPLLCG